jgi:2-dehydro-3-deoxyphosphooctonate aldolase (KDO 8-P synthase)
MTETLPKLSLPEGKIGPYPIGGTKASMVLVAGPCVIESLEHCLVMAEAIKRITDKYHIPFLFKASFDKANRSSIQSYRGPGLEKGLEILGKVKQQLKLPVVSDIHLPDQARPAGEVLDVIQIPAFLARQTDLLAAAAETGKCVNVKKAQFMAPWEMENVLGKLREGGAKSVVFTERGTLFGYNRWVVDMCAIEWMHRLSVPVLVDATHAAAEPGGAGSASGGQREMGPVLARAGVAAGADGLFLEVHDRPEQALSDAATVLPLSWLGELLDQCLEIFAAVRK